MGMSILLLLVISAFTAIIIWVFGRNRKARFVKDARIPFDERAESRPAEGKTNPENFYGVDRHGPPWEADERKDFLRSRPEGRGNSGQV